MGAHERAVELQCGASETDYVVGGFVVGFGVCTDAEDGALQAGVFADELRSRANITVPGEPGLGGIDYGLQA